MPYVSKEERVRFDELLQRARIEMLERHTPGDLNYLITRLCVMYVDIKGKNYTHLNDVVGVLECAKQEFYRRVVVPYENKKITENGDVY